MPFSRHLALLVTFVLLLVGALTDAAEPVRVLFVGGDWKSQLEDFQGKGPLRGYFVQREVDKAAPGRFAFTLWTSYEFLQYADGDSLRCFDVVVIGDVMGQSVVPRVVDGLREFVGGGGGLLYCDNHKAFSFYTKELSFDEVLPIDVVPFRAYDAQGKQPYCDEKPLAITPVASSHPIMGGFDWASAPPLEGARYGVLKPGAVVLATSPAGKPIWVEWDKGEGRALWLGGVFANDELSEKFSAWPQFGTFYAKTLGWLAEHAHYPRRSLTPAIAHGEVTVDIGSPGQTVTRKHFGIHGQEEAPGASPMQGADLALYQDLKLDHAFARTSAFTGIKREGQTFADDGVDADHHDASKYDWASADRTAADIERIHADPLFLFWLPWSGPAWPDAAHYTTYFAASIEHLNGKPPAYKPRFGWFEIANEPNIYPAAENLPRFADFYNRSVEALRPRAPGMKFGCGGINEWTYVQALIDRCGKNLDWFSRHPYGHTGEAIFALQDRYREYAASKGIPDLKFIITEWDFWIYGEPAFDYLMTRWKPLLDHADSCLGTMQYRWREYHEGGYVFGVHGEFDGAYGALPREWPNPGKDKPITYRYNAFWIMRDCCGKEFAAKIVSPELAAAKGPRAYAVATSDGKQYNLVLHYGYAFSDPKTGARYDRIKLHVHAPIPPGITGRSLVVSHADCRERREEPPRTIVGDAIDLDLDLPAQSAVSFTVR